MYDLAIDSHHQQSQQLEWCVNDETNNVGTRAIQKAGANRTANEGRKGAKRFPTEQNRKLVLLADLAFFAFEGNGNKRNRKPNFSDIDFVRENPLRDADMRWSRVGSALTHFRKQKESEARSRRKVFSHLGITISTLYMHESCWPGEQREQKKANLKASHAAKRYGKSSHDSENSWVKVALVVIFGENNEPTIDCESFVDLRHFDFFFFYGVVACGKKSFSFMV